MISASVILVRKDLDTALEALHDFGHFHIEDLSEAEKLAEYNDAVQQVKEDLTDAEMLIRNFGTDNGSFMDMFRAVKPVKVRITSENWQSLAKTVKHEVTSLKSETIELTTRLKNLLAQTSERRHIQDMLEAMEAIGTDLSAIKELKMIAIRVGCTPKNILPELERAIAGLPMVFHSCYLSKETSFICMAFPAKHESEVESVLKTHHTEIFEIPDDLPHDVPKALVEIKDRISENGKNQLNLNRSLQKLGVLNAHRLMSLKETAQNILVMLQAKQKVLQSDRLAIVQGFVPRSQLRLLEKKVDSKLKGNALVLGGEIAPSADPPTLIRNSRFVRPFEEITRLYGVPHYDELDPTPFIAIMFPVIFGLMFGDMGHGLVLIIGGLTLGHLIKNQKGIKNICWILAVSGVGAVIAGLLFGEFFGMQVFPPLWFSPFDNVLQFLIFTLFVGVVQILTGLILELADFALGRSWVDVFLTSSPKIVFYLGSVYLVVTYGLNLGAWITGPILIVIVPFAVLVFGKAVVLRANIKAYQQSGKQREQFSLGQRFFESGDLVTRLLSNTMSYTRILALLMAHWALLLVTYTVAGLVGTSALGMVFGGIIVVAGNIFVIALEGLIVFIHTLRLHFYEWFSKFYKGTGTPFSPFRQSFDYTQVVLGNSTES